MIEIQHLEKKYSNGFTPLKDVNAVINDGEVISIIGPSGTGKSTLLRCLNLLSPPTKGKILIDGEDITSDNVNLSKVRTKVGMVFQSFNLFNHLTVIENTMLPQIKLKNISKQEAFDNGMQLLKSLDLSDKYLSYPADLSGGQKQRVAIARTLAMDPDVVLFDEPTSALDPTTIESVKAVVSELSSQGKTLLLVTHDINLARNISSRIFYMDQGIIYEEGTPEELFENPQKIRTKNFIKRINSLTLDLSSETKLEEINEKIYTYCRNKQFSTVDTLNVQLIFEEIFEQILKKTLGDSLQGYVEIEYNSVSATTTEVFYCKGTPVSLDDCDEISMMLIKNKTKSISSYEENDYNVIKVEI